MKFKKIVTIGGGTGSYTLLSGLKKYPVELSAIVSMADDGGSTGRLRDELGVLPPGDVRQCLVALSESSEKMRRLMNFRFSDGTFAGHSFGNLLLGALEKLHGNFSDGIADAMEILNVRGEVIPVTNHDAKLRLRLKTGKILEGEDEINHSDIQTSGVEELRYHSRVGANRRGIAAIARADAIVIGPGNHYCSILPNLVISGIARAIHASRAHIVYVCNLTNKKGHTGGWTLEDYVSSIESHIGQGRIDAVIFNVKKPKQELLDRYERQEGKGFLVTQGDARKRTYRVVRARVVSNVTPKLNKNDAIASLRAFIRHDSDKLAKAIMLYLEMNGQKVIEEVV